MRPIIFLDIDDVLAISSEFTSYQIITTFKSGDLDNWPELWAGLFFTEARANLATLHSEFWPQYVVSSSWTNYLNREQMQLVFQRTGLEFVADNMHKRWTTPKADGPSRLDEIENWIANHGQRGQPILVLDDSASGWGLCDSFLDDKGLVVLCEPWTGFVAEKLADAQRLLRAQLQMSPQLRCGMPPTKRLIPLALEGKTAQKYPLEARQQARTKQSAVETARLTLHQQLASRLLSIPVEDAIALVTLAQAEVDRWQVLGTSSKDYIDLWREILQLPIPEIAAAICSDWRGWGIALRQNSPWRVVLRIKNAKGREAN
jgi:hypothetical protein